MHRSLVLPAVVVLLLACPVRSQVALDPATVPSADQTARMMHVPPGYRVVVFAAEPQVVNPLAIDFDDRGRAYVLEARQYPVKGPADQPGADRILVLEDTDGDDRADRVQVYADGLNLASGLAVGYGGVFVGQAPELLFLEDTDGDGRADRRKVLLTGWAYEDTHETLNSFRWGPDGWLYGTHGIMHHAVVRGLRFNAALWRYHPRTDHFEVVAEGTNNPWGLDFLPTGEPVISTSVIPHLYVIVPGAFHRHGLVRWWSNPFAYGEVPTIVDHRHFPPEYSGWDLVLRWPGAKSLNIADRSDDRVLAYGGGHAHSGLALTHGTAVQATYGPGALVGNLHGNRINFDRIRPYGSLYVATHGPDFLTCDDPFFRPVHLRWGPDGCLYVLDWYDRQICHNTEERVWDKKLGRIYKVIPPQRPAELGPKLLQRLASKYPWHWQRALERLAEKGSLDETCVRQLRDWLDGSDSNLALRALWALHVTGNLKREDLKRLVSDERAEVCRWAIRLLAEPEHRKRFASYAGELLAAARRSGSARIRRELASSAVRWPAGKTREALLHALMLHDEDVADPAIPAVLWVAYERDAVARRDQRAAWLAAHAERALVARFMLPWFARRMVEEKDPAVAAAALRLLRATDHAAALRRALEEMLQGLADVRGELRAEWLAARVELEHHLQGAADRLLIARVGVFFGDERAVAELIETVWSKDRSEAERSDALRALGYSEAPRARHALVQVATAKRVPAALRKVALEALKRGLTREQARALVDGWSGIPRSLRHEALLLLVTARVGVEELLHGLESGRIDRDEVPEGAVRRMLMLADVAIRKRIERAWGRVAAMTAPAARRQVARLGRALATLPGDRRRGAGLFAEHCAGCHRLRGSGHAVGPDLDGANLKDPFYLLYNIADPNRVVGATYFAALVRDRRGRVWKGLLQRRDASGITLKQEKGVLVRLTHEEIEEVRVLQESLMPEDLATRFDAQQFSDLVAYLMGDLYLDQGYWYGPVVGNRPLETEHPIERLADPLAYDREQWRPFRLGPAGKLILSLAGVQQHQRPPEAAYFVLAAVHSPDERQVTMVLDARKAARVWVNGKLLYEGKRLVVPVRFSVRLQEGRNVVLMKLANIVRDPNAPASAGECSVRAWMIDPRMELRLEPVRKMR